MSAIETAFTDIESTGASRRPNGRRRRRFRRPSIACSSETTTSSTTTAITDGSHCFSDSDVQSWRSPGGESCDECGSSAVEDVSYPHSRSLESCSASECPTDEVDLESGELEKKVHCLREEKDCRICHLVGDLDEIGVPIALGCKCKGDLGTAHKQCAETWFKIKGNRTCEICGSTALNVAVELINEDDNATGATEPAAMRAPVPSQAQQNLRQGRLVIYFLFACMAFAFIISWLFHINLIR